MHGGATRTGRLFWAANVLLQSRSEAPYGYVAKVSDFGLSRVLNAGATHRSTRTFGTITHMGPEVLRLGKISPAADVYAFGILMWELFTGSLAFGSMHYGEVFERVVLHDARPPLPPGMPEPFELLMTSCWHSDPLRRPAFDSVLRCLQLMLQEEQVQDAHAAAAPSAPPSAGAAEHSGGPGAGPADAAARRGAGGEPASGSALSNSVFIRDL
ncbi:hypothetical protein MNEG_7293 [Monoraphidium neglectum]|uniref:Protein kinase domain-containing protein n=1 Tax=Monoraphidium neglectum TaxID=145388 RepID=A0A0D2N3N4_9CHLO|nr:hypothetical protein MNEG_7293 [Monoraphidium neglectum]KIZ00671.1 hypothetical protein MNEG_7293 [Monoraphidium neglectum]|eukprot:XP_013899690.1 hypothetical protein MNEG_7293 [Monoraphidium neglectum]